MEDQPSDAAVSLLQELDIPVGLRDPEDRATDVDQRDRRLLPNVQLE
jgi:hypothetical protein